MSTRRPPLTRSQQALAAQGYPIAVRLAQRYGERNAVGYSVSDVQGIAHDSLIRGATTFDPSGGTPWEIYAWFRIKYDVKTAIKKRAKELGLVVHEDAQTRAGHLLRGALQGLEDYARALRDPGDFYKDSAEDYERHAGDLGDGAGAAVAAGAAGAAWYMQGDEGFALREEYVRAHIHLRQEASALGPKHQAIFQMRYVQGLKIDEIVTATGLSKATVERRLAEMIDELRDRLRARGTTGAPSPDGR